MKYDFPNNIFCSAPETAIIITLSLNLDHAARPTPSNYIAVSRCEAHL